MQITTSFQRLPLSHLWHHVVEQWGVCFSPKALWSIAEARLCALCIMKKQEQARLEKRLSQAFTVGSTDFECRPTWEERKSRHTRGQPLSYSGSHPSSRICVKRRPKSSKAGGGNSLQPHIQTLLELNDAVPISKRANASDTRLGRPSHG